MANPAYSVDFNPVENIGNEMVQGAALKGQQAFQGAQMANMQSEMAYRGEEQKKMAVDTAIKNIELDKAQKEKAAGEKFVPFSLLDPLKEKAPKVYETYMSFAKQFETEVGGVKGFTANDQQTVKKMMADNNDMQRQIGLAHIQDLDEQRAKRKNKIDDLTAEIENGKRDPRGALIPNPKKQSELRGLQAEDKKDADQQVAALNHVKTIEERIATEKIQQQAQAKQEQERIKQEQENKRAAEHNATILKAAQIKAANAKTKAEKNETFEQYVKDWQEANPDKNADRVALYDQFKGAGKKSKQPIPFGGGATPQGKKDSFGHVQVVCDGKVIGTVDCQSR